MDGVVSAFGAADRPWRAGIARAWSQRVVWPFTEGSADGMDWREIDHVEAHGRRCLEPVVRGVEGAGYPTLVLLIPLRTLRARKELIPGREQRLTTIDEDRIVRCRRDQLARSVALHCRSYVLGQYDLEPVFHLLPGVQVLGRPLQQCCGLIVPVILSVSSRAFKQRHAFSAHQGNVDAGWDLDFCGVYPGRPRIAPALNAECPQTLGLEYDRGSPPIEPLRGRAVHRLHARSATWVSEHHRGVDSIVTFTEHGRTDRNSLPDHSLGRIGAALDHR